MTNALVIVGENGVLGEKGSKTQMPLHWPYSPKSKTKEMLAIASLRLQFLKTTFSREM